MLQDALVASGPGDVLPSKPTPKHASMCIAFAQGLSIQEVASASGFSSRSCERYRHSTAVVLVVSELRKMHYEHDLRGNADAIASGPSTQDWTMQEITMTSDPAYADATKTMTPPATSSKAEDRPSLPPPEYLRSIEPMWSFGAVKENDDAPLPLPGDEK
jgi:hypothetical protein